MKKILMPAMLIFAVSSFCFADTIHVPDDQPTIQAGIDAAENGDIVLVDQGLYQENIDFKGKDIIVQSVLGSALTVIAGDEPIEPDEGSVVLFRNGETSRTKLIGFGLAHGTGTFHGKTATFLGGGIYCVGSSPTIERCRIVLNTAEEGGGVFIENGSPQFIYCSFEGNAASGSSGSACCGGAMSVWEQSEPFFPIRILI